MSVCKVRCRFRDAIKGERRCSDVERRERRRKIRTAETDEERKWQ